jgi:hypothetical protein
MSLGKKREWIGLYRDFLFEVNSSSGFVEVKVLGIGS